MSKRNDTSKKRTLKNETLQGIFSVVCFVLAIFLVLAFFDIAGPAGNAAKDWVIASLGVIGYFMLPLILMMLSVAFLRSLHQEFSLTKIIGSLVFFLAGLGIVDIVSTNRGGFIGKMVSLPFLKLFYPVVSVIFLCALLLISFLVIFDTGINISLLWSLFTRFIVGKNKVKISGTKDSEGNDFEKGDPNDVPTTGESGELKSADKKEKPVKVTADSQSDFSAKEKNGEFAVNQNQFKYFGKKAVPIPLNLLEKDRGTPGVGDIKANVNIIKRTLQNFGIEVEMDEVTIGPTVTRYSLKPAEGVKLSRIVGLQDNLSLNLAAHPIRIEAPIPGKSLVGIEIPNSTKTIVGLASMLSAEEFQKSDKPLLVVLGKAISGKCIFGNLGKMPHLLIAGATGSGKSVSIHAIITSLLYRNSPENLKFIMIDPKRVELTLYNKIPHLLTPVITEAKKTILALKWAAKEMDRRYDILEAEQVRDIESYHKNVLGPALKNLSNRKENISTDETPKIPEAMPYIVIVIDELADIMTAYPRELEAAVVRLAQMSRAVGIHLILSTQRPSVNVITGLIKANIPARIALQVASQIDSRTILDAGGAEKLLGSGDMLYLSGDMSKPSRLQSAFISEGEVKKVVKFLVDSYVDELPSELNITEQPADDTIFQASLEDENSLEEDDFYEQAREEVIRAGKASTSYLQRKLSVGYARAARLIDMLEERGVIGPGHGAKPREVIGGKPPADENGENVI